MKYKFTLFLLSLIFLIVFFSSESSSEQSSRSRIEEEALQDAKKKSLFQNKAFSVFKKKKAGKISDDEGRIVVAEFPTDASEFALTTEEGSELIGPESFSFVDKNNYTVLDQFSRSLLVNHNGNLYRHSFEEGVFPRGVLFLPEKGMILVLKRKNKELLLEKLSPEGRSLEENVLDVNSKDFLYSSAGIKIIQRSERIYFENLGNYYEVLEDGHVEKAPGLALMGADEGLYVNYALSQKGYYAQIFNSNHEVERNVFLGDEYLSIHALYPRKNGGFFVAFEKHEKSTVDDQEIVTPTFVLQEYNKRGGRKRHDTILSNESEAQISQSLDIDSEGKVFQMLQEDQRIFIKESKI